VSDEGERAGAQATAPAPEHADDRIADRAAYFYAVLRIVPRVERGERFNAGVVLFSRSRRFLGVRTSLDGRKLAALAPGQDAETVRGQLLAMEAVAVGAADGGPIARLDLAERFHWLTSSSSTMIQPSAVHTGLTDDPAKTLERLFRELVE
jgi:hypothetical protein